MKISIIVPVYNVENYLEKCIDSILSQSYKNIELILINDGSLDKSGEICDRYKSDNVKIIHKKNTGLSETRNLGIKASTGEYLMFVDSDDWIVEDCISEIVNLIKEN
ncbi:glycosyltransferase family 2 protein, partial [Clostridium perfringens]